jgi:hypothetical protein
MMINADEFETQWKEIRKQVRPRWQAITDAEVNRIDGHVDVLLDLLEEKYDYSRLLAEDEVSRFLQDMHPVRTS